MTKAYRTAEFAKLGGVTVRTLQYYDRIGLLQPAAITAAGYRLYSATDLLRLQQIVTLKWMGFALEQIKMLLDSPSYDLKQALTAQKAVLDAQIERLHAASSALERAIESADAHDADLLDAEMLQVVTRAVTHQGALMDEYYSETAQAGIALRRLTYDPQQMAEMQVEWQTLYTTFATLVKQPLDDPRVLKLAARMDELISAFPGGDPETEAGLRRLISDAQAGKLPTAPHVQVHFATVDDEQRHFMQQALTHYRTLKKRNKLK